MNCPKCKYPMEHRYDPFPPDLPFWTTATLFKCFQCNTEWLKVGNTELAAIDAALGKDVIPSGWYIWNGADTLPNLLKRKDELWDIRAEQQRRKLNEKN